MFWSELFLCDIVLKTIPPADLQESALHWYPNNIWLKIYFSWYNNIFNINSNCFKSEYFFYFVIFSFPRPAGERAAAPQPHQGGPRVPGDGKEDAQAQQAGGGRDGVPLWSRQLQEVLFLTSWWGARRSAVVEPPTAESSSSNKLAGARRSAVVEPPTAASSSYSVLIKRFIELYTKMFYFTLKSKISRNAIVAPPTAASSSSSLGIKF